MSHSHDEKRTLSRREALRAVAAATGAIALANLPEQWISPVIETGVLPAHAQTSPQPPAAPTETPTAAPTATPTATAPLLPFRAACDPAPSPVQAGVPTNVKVIFTGDVPVDGTQMVLTFSPGIITPVTATATNGQYNFDFTPPANSAGQTISYRADFTASTVTTRSGNTVDVSGFNGVDCDSSTISNQ